MQELRRKDWEDLHRLWWVCIKEKNKVETFKKERQRVGSMYGDFEADARAKEVSFCTRCFSIDYADVRIGSSDDAQYQVRLDGTMVHLGERAQCGYAG